MYFYNMKNLVLIYVAFAALVVGDEIEDTEQKKRGVEKGNNVNTISTGSQKQDYTYSIYPESQYSLTYQSQVPNTIYPNQGNVQYYTNGPTVSSYPSQSQISFVPTQNGYAPFNIAPSTGYQTKYQLIPAKTQNGHIQLAVIQQPGYSSVLSYPHQFYASAGQQINQQSPLIGPTNPFYQTYVGTPYLNQPSVVLVGASNPSQYNNLAYSNSQGLYYPSNTQTKYSNSYHQPSSGGYEKVAPSNPPKEDNSISVSNEYDSQSTSYKNSFTPNRGTAYSKLK